MRFSSIGSIPVRSPVSKTLRGRTRFARFAPVISRKDCAPYSQKRLSLTFPISPGDRIRSVSVVTGFVHCSADSSLSRDFLCGGMSVFVIAGTVPCGLPFQIVFNRLHAPIEMVWQPIRKGHDGGREAGPRGND